MKTCICCGASFAPSRTDSTVRCPACRARRRDYAQATGRDICKTKLCKCGKTVYVDGFGAATGNTCPRHCEPNAIDRAFARHGITR
jgi:hypothetical protein